MSNIGAKRERIRIVRPARTRRTDGGYDTGTTTVAEFWAHIKPVQGTEAERAGRLRSATTYVITAPRVDGLTSDDTIVWLTRGSLAMNIREIRTDGIRMIDMQLIAETGVTL